MSGDTLRIDPTWRLGAPDAPAKPCLVVIFGPQLGRRIPLEEPTLIVGRVAGNDVLVPLDGISREHCQLSVRDGAVSVRDLDSTNGTWLNGRPLPPRQDVPLFSGDRLELGGLVLKFLEGGDVESKYHEELYQLTIADGLTRAFNRRYLLDFLEREISRARRHERPLSLLLLDVDDFRELNRRFGHAGGDHVLCELVALLGRMVRREECLARLEDDAFALALPETSASGARILAERIRERVERSRFAAPAGPIRVTVSLGLATLAPGLADAAALLAAAGAELTAARTGEPEAAAG